MRWLGIRIPAFIAVFAAVFTLLAPVHAANAAQEKTEQKYLRLINWDNPYTGNDYTLVRLDTVIDKDLVIMKNYHLIDQTAGMAANAMFRAAAAEGIGKYEIDNAYRSLQTQESLWNKRVKRNPQYGADPYHDPVKVLPSGKSEHASGLALDILSKSHKKANAAYGDTTEGKWLAQNAHRFGFILRYPKNKQQITGVIYEPWHFRYVGMEAAASMYESGACLEEYYSAAKSVDTGNAARY